VVKAQIHAGGRGKGGGVKVAKSLDEVHQFASAILGMTLVTHQTGPEGRVVKRLLVEEGADIRKELYVGMVVDRASQRVTLMASSEGGMEIEEVAAHSPEKIHKVAIDPVDGLTEHQANDISRKIGVPEASLAQDLKGLAADDETKAISVNRVEQIVGVLIDRTDAAFEERIRELGMRVLVDDTVMADADGERRFAAALAQRLESTDGS